MKPGYKTSEFWLMLASIGLTKSGIGVDPEHVATVVDYLPMLGASIYAIARAIVKFAGGGR